jgi:hypothetical protein
MGLVRRLCSLRAILNLLKAGKAEYATSWLLCELHLLGQLLCTCTACCWGAYYILCPGSDLGVYWNWMLFLMVLHASTVLKLSVLFLIMFRIGTISAFPFSYCFSGYSVIPSVDSFYKMFDRLTQGFDKIWDTTFLHRLFKEFHLFTSEEISFSKLTDIHSA